jgi:methylmalonyl-CoA/ethylmalonyl-CoA epimerase
MDTQFAKFLQIGIIVEDIEATKKRYEEVYGIGPWHTIEFGPKMFPKMLVNGKPGMHEMKNAFCQIYGFELELIQPISESPYSVWLREHGQGIHHIAVITRDKFADVIAEHERLTGKQTWFRCKEDNGIDGEGMEFAYLDLIKELGIFVEIYNEDKKGGLEA